MPEPPPHNLLTRYLLENPWPLAIVALAVGVVLAWTGLREGLRARQRAGAAFAMAGLAALLIGGMVETAGERARKVTRALVQAAVAKDTATAVGLFSPDAVLALGSAANPGVDLDGITDRLQQLAARYTIDSNTITMLKGYTVSSSEAEAHLACLTQVSGFSNMSQWVLRVQRQDDGTWKISHVTWVSLNGNPPRWWP